jgi:hypothetical protein
MSLANLEMCRIIRPRAPGQFHSQIQKPEGPRPILVPINNVGREDCVFLRRSSLHARLAEE